MMTYNSKVNPEEYHKLLSFLPLFEVDEFMPIVGRSASGFLEYRPIVDAFCTELRKECWIDCDYTEKDLDCSKIATADFAQIQAFLTSFWRRERFCEGHMEGIFEDGIVVDLLLRLEVLNGGITLSRSPQTGT
jgi:hypothetical protein